MYRKDLLWWNKGTRLRIMIMIYEYICSRYVSFVNSEDNFGTWYTGRWDNDHQRIRWSTASVTSRSLVLIRCPFFLVALTPSLFLLQITAPRSETWLDYLSAIVCTILVLTPFSFLFYFIRRRNFKEYPFMKPENLISLRKWSCYIFYEYKRNDTSSLLYSL